MPFDLPRASPSDPIRWFELDDLLILLVLLVSSRAALVNYDEPFLVLVFAITGSVWVWRGARLAWAALVFLFVTLFWLALHSVQSSHLNPTTAIGHFLRLLVAFFVLGSVDDPIDRFAKWVVRLSAVGLVLFSVTSIVPDLAERLYALTPESLRFVGGTQAGENLTGAWRRANWFIFTLSPDRISQNHGFMWEPAAFAMITMLAMWARILSGRAGLDKPNLILMLAVVSTVSTTGALGFGLTIIVLFARYRAAGAVALFFVLPVMILCFVQSDFLLSKITSEFDAGYTDHMQWSLSRMASFQLDMKEFFTAPFIGVGIMTEAHPLAGDRLPSNNGFSDFLNRYGVLMTLYGACLLAISVRRQFQTSSPMIFAFFLIVFIFSWSEKFFELPVFYLWVFSGFLWKEQQTGERWSRRPLPTG